MNPHARWLKMTAVPLLLVALVAGTPLGLEAQSDQTAAPPSAETLIEIAKTTAAIDGRNIMVRFRASWCEWCARLEAALHSFELGWIIRDNYVLVSLTVQESEDKAALETPGAQELMDALGGEGAGIPFYVFMDSEGEWISDSMAMPGGTNVGYPVTPEEIEAFSALIKRTAPRLSAADQDLVFQYLTENAPEF
jgi:thiol:disulfide interchange protein